MAKKSRTPRDLLAAKKDELNWSLFHFLENLLVFCAMGTRSAPPESGVQFQISSKIKSDGVCLLFRIDRRHDPLMPAAGVKPDYLTVHVTSERCLCTIIEMKGRDEKNLEHGVDQIKALRDRLHDEVREHLPTACKIKFQGILLAPYNAQLPLPRLAKEARAGLTILPIRYTHKAELYPYVRKLNAIAEQYEHTTLPRDKDELNPIEALLARCALPVRIDDPFRARHVRPRQGRSGIYLNYVRPNGPADEYGVLVANSDRAVVAAPAPASSFVDEIRAALGRLRLGWTERIEFTTFTAPAPR
ncbi:hypothetical protein BE17_17925 [Sorangium cellulosum]|uniref:Uncharacterized protein n=1 Tax=Sorangium cellulosum TaxID=56 RepID=A0A150RBP3_SORCE|nr:hypothetical protein BE17_17925 [Sorangium cellulosum]